MKQDSLANLLNEMALYFCKSLTFFQVLKIYFRIGSHSDIRAIKIYRIGLKKM